MNLTPEIKAQIDSKSHYDLLRRIRFAPLGDEMMQGESGEYWMKRRGELQDKDPGLAVADSKRMGW